MKRHPHLLLAHAVSLTLWLLAASPSFGQSATIGYQGQLTEAGRLASGPYDMQFKLFDTAAVASGAQKGSTLAQSAVPVANGVFAVNLDFGVAVFDGSPRFLEIGVRPGASGISYTILAPRQQVASVPYAIQSLNAATAATALNVASGSVVKSLNGLKDNVTLAVGPNATLTQTGNTLTIDAKPSGAGGGSGLWSLAGVNAYYNAGNVGIGTSTPANKLTVRTPTLGYGLEHTDGDIRLSTFVGRGAGYLGTLSNHKLTFFANDNGLPSLTMTLDTAGAVGLGTDSPTPGYRLEVNGSTLLRSASGTVQFGTPNAETGMSITPTAGNRADLRFDGSTLKLVAGPAGGPPSSANGIAITTAGNVGIGTASPGFKLDVLSANSTAIVGRNTSSAVGAGAGVYGESAAFNGVRGLAHNAAHGGVVGIHDGGGIAVFGTGATGVQGESTSAGGYGGYFYNTAGGIALGVQGTARVGVLQITGGADFAENFDVHVAATSNEAITRKVEAGMVVSIDPINPGKLALSTQAYDRRVAGIISGAGGVKPGVMMSQEGTLADGQYPVALTGRVYCRVDAAYGSIQPGDLLTTSDTPGLAMRAADSARAQGAILGKAMSGLKEGQGTVLVLVTLQ